MNLDIEALENNTDYRISLVIQTPASAPGAAVLEGFLTGGMSFSGSAEFGSKSGSIAEIISSAATNGVSIVNAISEYFNRSERISNKKIGNAASTVLQWSDSGPWGFSIEFVVVAYKPEHDVRKMVEPLWDALYPETVTDSVTTPFTSAPMGYTTKTLKMDVENAIYCWIGEWFSCDKLVMTDGSISYSKELVTNGSPLFATVSCTMQGTRMFSAKEIKGFFK